MQPNINKTIERYLDQQLGVWTRILPWRHEMAVHLQEAYEASQSQTVEKDNSGTAWHIALANFGNVQQVACQLRHEHWPQHIGWRLLAAVAAFSVVFSIANPWALLDLPSLGFAIVPAIVFVCVDLSRGSTRWGLANQVGTWGCLSGTVAGVGYILTDFESPSRLGAGMALSILSALYCVLFFTPNRKLVVALLGIVLVDCVLMLVQWHAWYVAHGSPILIESCLPQNWSVDKAWVVRVLTLLGSGIGLGLVRFGIHGIARNACSVGAGVFLVSLVVLLGDTSDPAKVIGHLLVALGAMILAIAGSHCVSNSSRLMLRFLR